MWSIAMPMCLEQSSILLAVIASIAIFISSPAIFTSFAILASVSLAIASPTIFMVGASQVVFIISSAKDGAALKARAKRAAASVVLIMFVLHKKSCGTFVPQLVCTLTFTLANKLTTQ